MFPDVIAGSDGMLLQLAVGGETLAGIKASNEDAISQKLPSDKHLLVHKGACFCVADGVSSAEAGQEASHYAVKYFAEEYLNTPDSWSVPYSAGQLIATINSALYKQSHQFSNNEKGFLTTFDALVVKSRTAYWFHIGDGRIYLWRQGLLRQLTQDHTTVLSESRQFLGRALGMDQSVLWDQDAISIENGDRFLLCTDGLYDFVEESELFAALSSERSAEQVSAESPTAHREAETAKAHRG